MNSTALCGLVATSDTATELVPLTEVDVRVRIVGPTSRTTVRQRYENRESVPVEATYLFPLEDGSAVCSFAVTLDGHRLQGRVDERDAAFDAYDDAMSEGHAAFLLDQERPNLFTASVGNLLPGQVAEIELSYVSALPRAGEGFRFALPTAITPRYHGHVNSAERMDDVERGALRRPRSELSRLEHRCSIRGLPADPAPQETPPIAPSRSLSDHPLAWFPAPL